MQTAPSSDRRNAATVPGTVLVVEDEALTNWNVSDVLRDDGFAVLQAYSGEAALAILQQRRDVRLVFTDINLGPGIDGITLADEVERRWPQVGLLMTSALHRLQDELPESVMQQGRFVPKPCPPEAIARRIHEILDPPASENRRRLSA
jgi:DNA-binding response OmpR family regulator